MREFDTNYVEKLLTVLENGNHLFPQFALKTENDRLISLGKGGFSLVYEMYNRKRPELEYALKVNGFKTYSVDSEKFENNSRIHCLLCQSSKYITRVLGYKELLLILDSDGELLEVKNSAGEKYSCQDNSLLIQLTLEEKLSPVMVKDRFQNVSLTRADLGTEREVLSFALEIGQALATTHLNGWLHRDVKLENIFWDEQEQVYKIGDFGIARNTDEGDAETAIYTNGYGAPEIKRGGLEGYNSTADIYSFGITLYLLLNNLCFPGSDG